MTMTITSATLRDIADLRQLYFDVYGHGYPVALGSDPAVMRRLIVDPDTFWLTARRTGTGELAGSAVVQTDPGTRVGKLVGLAVHPAHRQAGLAGQLTGSVCAAAFDGDGVDSVYATVRMVTRGPQNVVLRNGFRPVGLMPNAAEVEGCESLALFVRYADDVLTRRERVAEVPEALLPLLRACEDSTGIGFGPVTAAPAATNPARTARRSGADFELLDAPGFVRRRFLELFPDPASRFFPLHTPNAVLLPGDGHFEAYAQLDRAAGSCALVAVHPHLDAVTHSLEPLMDAVARAGADYVEALLPLADSAGLAAFLAQGFVPGAVYPAMRRTADRFHDYVVLSRTSRQIDFRDVAADGLLQPYLSAYLTAWTSTYLPLPEVVS